MKTPAKQAFSDNENTRIASAPMKDKQACGDNKTTRKRRKTLEHNRAQALVTIQCAWQKFADALAAQFFVHRAEAAGIFGRQNLGSAPTPQCKFLPDTL